MVKTRTKLTGHSYACNSLKNFEYEAYAMTGNGNQVNLLNFRGKFREITSSELIYDGFQPFGTTVLRKTSEFLIFEFKRVKINKGILPTSSQ